MSNGVPGDCVDAKGFFYQGLYLLKKNSFRQNLGNGKIKPMKIIWLAQCAAFNCSPRHATIYCGISERGLIALKRYKVNLIIDP